MTTIETSESLKRWMRDLPTAQMVYPTVFSERLRYFFWGIITPFHPYFRDGLTALGLLRHNFRQDFLIGHVREGQSLQELIGHLIGQGYGIHFIAWRDTGEIVSMRKVDNFKYQHHIRIFEDGEVRAHYEYTPECHPILHMREIGMIDRTPEFLELLENRVVPLQ
ncbi:MAG: hypothetical protein AAB472_02750 [Patescibacteria group bacterium]